MASERGSGRKAHGIEQLGGVAGDVAHPVAAFYRALLAEGLPEPAALSLASVFLGKMLGDVERPAE